MNHNAVFLLLLNICHLFCQIPHIKIGPEETPRLPYLRFASVTLYPSNEDLSLAIGAILRSFSYPSASLVCAKAECEYTLCHRAIQCVFVYTYNRMTAVLQASSHLEHSIGHCGYKFLPAAWSSEHDLCHHILLNYSWSHTLSQPVFKCFPILEEPRGACD